MLLIVGLGNPGKQYALTRHNVGWLVVDTLAKQQQLNWKSQKKLHAEIAKSGEMILAKPQTFMNLSGIAVQNILKHYSLFSILYSLVIIHDDIDLPFGTIRVSHNASSAGHRGVQSIIDHLGSKDFWRVRIGIRPMQKIVNRKSEIVNRVSTPEFVLKPFSREEKKKLPAIIETILEVFDEFKYQKQSIKTIHRAL